MAELKELKRLRDEERTLISLASLLTDQLNRLKVEELALLNKRRLQNTSATSKNEQEVYLAEEMTKEHAQNYTSEEQEAPHQFLATVENVNSNGQISHAADIRGHVIPIDLSVNDHRDEASVEMEEEDDDDTT